MKKFILSMLAMLSGFFAESKVTQSVSLKNIDPNSVVICWDIHDTLLDQSKKHTQTRNSLVRTLLFECWEAIPFARAAAKRHAASGYTEYQLLQEAIKYDTKATRAMLFGKKNKVKKYARIAQKLRKAASLFGQFELCYQDKDGVIPMINALKDRGYTQHHVASNIDCNKYQEIKTMFPHYFNDHMIQDGLTVNLYEQPSIQKPDHMFYKKLHHMFNPNGDKTLVFIDDKQENVDAACSCNMIGIRIKNVKQLIQEFNKIGINLHYSKQKQCVNGKRKKVIQIA